MTNNTTKVKSEIKRYEVKYKSVKSDFDKLNSKLK